MENARLFSELHTLYTREKRIAETMQRSLLPVTPQVAGVFEFAHIYQAGLDESVIGGDFLDLIRLSPTRMGVVIADVSGKGLRAAVQTAMIKYTLRAFAQEEPLNPGSVLSRVNDVFCADASGLQGFVTLFYGVLNVTTGEFCYACGGHETPLLCGADGQVTPLEIGDGIALGCQASMRFEQKRHPLRALRFARALHRRPDRGARHAKQISSVLKACKNSSPPPPTPASPSTTSTTASAASPATSSATTPP